MIGESVGVALRVLEVFDRLGIRYHVAGSFASSIHGVPRQTRDLDLVADLPVETVPALVALLERDFYLDAESVRRAIARHISFNLLHLDTGFKIDVFPLGPTAFDRSEFHRAAPQRLVDEPPREVFVKSAEDILLRKLEWYRAGGEVSDRQWTDVLGIVRTQGNRLDFDYLRRWAEELRVEDLLERALAAGSDPDPAPS